MLEIMLKTFYIIYKIYYEKFPEGSGLWRENYPWSNNAGSTLVFWAGLKAVSTGVELASSILEATFLIFMRLFVPFQIIK